MNGYKRTELMQLGGKKERGQQHPKRERGIIFIYIDIYKGDMTAFLRPLLSPIVIVTYREGSPLSPDYYTLEEFQDEQNKVGGRSGM